MNKRKIVFFSLVPIFIHMKNNIDIEKLKETVKKSESMGHLLQLLGKVKAGGNYLTMRHKIKEFNIDVSHWELTRKKRQGWQKDKIGWREIPFSEILIENSKYKGGSYRLKNRLLRSNMFDRKCYNCNNTLWLNNPIPLELEHINGNKFDCRKENLTLLCPNCHALTPTYRGKNRDTY